MPFPSIQTEMNYLKKWVIDDFRCWQEHVAYRVGKRVAQGSYICLDGENDIRCSSMINDFFVLYSLSWFAVFG